MTTQTPTPVTKILPETVLKVTDGNSYYYRCKAIATLNDGKVLEFAIKTKLGGQGIDTVLIKINNKYVPAQPSDIVANITAKFFIFLNLMLKCFGDKAKDGRNKLVFLGDRLLKDETPTTERMRYSSTITQSICLVNGKLVRMKDADFYQDATYFERPLDLSSDWVKIENPSVAFRQAVENAQDWYKTQMQRHNRRTYHKDLVKQGVRI